MCQRHWLAALIAAPLIVVAATACDPTPSPPPPPVAVFGGEWWDAVKRATSWLWGSPPDNTHVDCSVVLFDQSIRAADFRGQFTPVHTPNDIYAWLMACLGAGRGHHTVPTHKASNRPNSFNPNKQAVCWVHNFVPDGDLIFDCYFDRILPQQAWVPSISTSWDGYMAVGTN